MVSRRNRAVLLSACWLLAVQFLQSQPSSDPVPPSFRVRANFIRVPVTVFGPTGKLLTHLDREHFSLLDENSPRAIENFVLDQDRIHVALLLDVSGSIRSELKEIAKAALDFARSFQRNDRISVITFSDRVQVLQDWTSSLRAVRRALRKLEPGYRTAMYDALWTTTNRQLSRVAREEGHHPAHRRPGQRERPELRPDRPAPDRFQRRPLHHQQDPPDPGRSGPQQPGGISEPGHVGVGESGRGLRRSLLRAEGAGHGSTWPRPPAEGLSFPRGWRSSRTGTWNWPGSSRASTSSPSVHRSVRNIGFGPSGSNAANPPARSSTAASTTGPVRSA